MSIDNKVKKKLGFGCMRMHMKGDEVDYELFTQLVDTFLENGFNYFDTAHGYLNGQSEVAIRKCLTSRHPRESYVLTNKLSTLHFEKEEDIRPLFESQLETCGVEYFDFYLMHAQNASRHKKYLACRAYEIAAELKAEGKIRHVGISFHDTAEVLDKILTDCPQIEVVQLQLNYVDFEDASVQSGKCYEVCRKHGKPVIVMEPVRGGNLVKLPEEAQTIFDDLKGSSNASYAIRFAAGFENVMMVLSGMNEMEHMLDNISYMKDFQPLSAQEQEAVNEVCRIFRSKRLIPCTACRYCTDVCPTGIDIPLLFSCMNNKKLFNFSGTYYKIYTQNGRKASDCIKCGQCESICPQNLPIRSLLADVAAEYDG